MLQKRVIAVLLGGCLLGGAIFPAVAASPVEEGRRLLDAGKGRAAWNLLEPVESELAGEPLYDFLLGLAALDVGENTRAVFALERVLAMEPNNVRARAEIARAYLALGEVATARQEFETVQRQGVPADVSLTLDRYIAQARRQENGDKASLNAYLEAQLGYDSNVNAGPNRSSVTFPNGFTIPLPPDVKANEDVFGQASGGANGKLPLGRHVALLGGVSGSLRFNADKSQFNLGNGDANAGVVVTAGRNVFTVMGQGGLVRLDGENFRSVFGVTGQWQHNLDARNQVNVFAQYANLNYLTAPQRDVGRSLLGASYGYMWRSGAIGFASVYGVREKPQHDNQDHYDFTGFGSRLGGRISLGERTIAYAGLSYEQRDYGSELSAAVERRDRQFDVLLGATYSFAPQWTLTPQVSWTVNKSNYDLNDYHREMATLAIRREF